MRQLLRFRTSSSTSFFFISIFSFDSSGLRRFSIQYPKFLLSTATMLTSWSLIVVLKHQESDKVHRTLADNLPPTTRLMFSSTTSGNLTFLTLLLPGWVLKALRSFGLSLIFLSNSSGRATAGKVVTNYQTQLV